MEHIYTIPSLKVVQKKSEFDKVAVSATVYLITKDTFEHTFEKEEFTPEEGSTTSTVTENKTAEHFQQFEVNFNTSNLKSSDFVNFDDLTEEQVVEWVKSVKDVTDIEAEGASIVADKKDKILKPEEYTFDYPVTPWVARANAAKLEGTN